MARLPPAVAGLLALGLGAGVAQAVLLREAMAALGGSELAWGAVLSVWLAGMGAGAWAGEKLRAPRLALAGGPLQLVLAFAGVIALRAAPALAGGIPGEAATTWSAGWLWVLATLPAALAGGWAFPSLIAGAGGAGRSYALEAAGTLAAGLAFTFLLAPLGSAATLALAAAGAAALVLLAIARPVAAVVILLLGPIGAVPLSGWLANAGWRWSGRPGELAAWAETRQQRLELTAGEPAVLWSDGRYVATHPDPHRVAARAHVALLLHPAPRRVLAAGALADGSFVTMLRHPLERLDIVEEDAEEAGILLRWLAPALGAGVSDPRLSLHGGELLRHVRGDRWDVIVLLDGDPTSIRRNRSRTREAFAACAAALTPEGILVVRVGVSDTYLGGAGGRLLAVLAATAREVLPVVRAIPGDEVLLVASRKPVVSDPDTLAARWLMRSLHDPDITREMLPSLLDPERAVSLHAFLDQASSAPNSAARPRAVLAAAALVEGRGSPPLLAAAGWLESRAWPLPAAGIALTVVLLAMLARVPIGAGVAVVVGLASMGWWLLLLTAWQATVGAVYSEIGALSAAFMAGVVAGGLSASRAGAGPRPLAALLGAGCLLSLALASAVPLGWPRLAVPPLLLLAGALTGAAFPSLARLAADGDESRGAARAFAADEAGAAVGAALIGLVALPVLGSEIAALSLAFLGAAAAATVLISSRRGR